MIETDFNETIALRVMHYLRDQILVYQTYRKGDKLVESDIAEKLNISRAPVRDALRQLENQGLVNSVPRKGTFVADYSSESLEEIYDLRFILECRIYEILTKQNLLSDEDFNQMEKLVDQMGETACRNIDFESKISEFVFKDVEFHKFTWSKARRPHTKKILTDLYNQLKLGMFEDLLHERDLQAIVQSHRKIIEDLRKGDLEEIKKGRAHSLFGRRVSNIGKA